MTLTTRVWLWIGFTGMTIGAVIFGSKAVAARKREGIELYLTSFFTVFWAAIVYLSMAINEIVTPVTTQKVLIDGVVTTPLLLLELGIVAGLRPKLIAGVMVTDVLMILMGAIASLEPPPISYIWYSISVGAFIAIAASLLTDFTASAALRKVEVNNLFKTLRNALIV